MTDEWFGGASQEVFDGSALDDASGVHEQYLATKERRFGHVVRDQHNGFAQRYENLPQVFLQFVPHQRIEGAQGLVQQQQRRVEHQGPHQRHALTLATGELGGIPFEQFHGEFGQTGQ